MTGIGNMLLDYIEVAETIDSFFDCRMDPDFDVEVHRLDVELTSHLVTPAITDGDTDLLAQVARDGYLRAVKLA